MEGKMESEETIFLGALHFSSALQHWNYDYDDTTRNDHKYWETALHLAEKIQGLFYINKSNFFLSAYGNGLVSWRHHHLYEDDSIYKDYIDGAYTLASEIGFGRLRDGTASWKAMEIERVLIAEELIDEPFSKDFILSVAQIINQEWNFRIRYERFSKYYYEEINKVLKANGVVEIPAYVWFRLKEIVELEVQPREFGLQMSGGLAADGSAYYTYFYDNDTVITQSHGYHPTKIKITFNSAYPLTYRLQYNERLDIFFDIAYGQDISFNSMIDLSYRVSDKLDISLENSLNYYTYQKSDIEQNGEKILTQRVSLSFMYYIENRVRITLRNLFQHEWKYYPSQKNIFSAGLSLTYDAL